MAKVMCVASGSVLRSAAEVASPCARACLGDAQPSTSWPANGTGGARSALPRPAMCQASGSSPDQDSLRSSQSKVDRGELAALGKASPSSRGSGSAKRRGFVRAQLAPVVEGPPVKPESPAGPGVGATTNGAPFGALNGHAASAPVSVPHTPSTSAAAPPGGSKLTLASIIAPVTTDLQQLNEDLKMVVGARHPMLMAAAENIFGAGGKRMRPALVFLVSQATAQLANLDGMTHRHKRLAMVTELIHTASLVHDDVLDDSDTRRGKITVHQKYGTRVAVLAGDFMFAQSSWYLANLDNLEVIKLISQVIADFANGEISQAGSLFDTGLTMEQYMDKSYFKTASLLAASTKSAAIFSGVPPAVCDQMFEYGRHLGLAFQVVDDILDFTQTSEQLGKPAGSDLASGNLTAPALYALKGPGGDRLRDLIDGEFVEEGALAEAVSLVVEGGGVERSRELAREEGELARQSLSCLPDGEARECLHAMIDYVLDRSY